MESFTGSFGEIALLRTRIGLSHGAARAPILTVVSQSKPHVYQLCVLYRLVSYAHTTNGDQAVVIVVSSDPRSGVASASH